MYVRTLPAITGEINVSKMTETSKRVFRGHLIVHFIKQTESRAPYPVDKVIELQMPCFDPFYAALPIPQPVQKPQDAAQDSKIYVMNEAWKIMHDKECNVDDCQSLIEYSSKKPILSGKGKSDPKTPSLIPNVPTGPRSAHFHRKSPRQNQHNGISTSWPTQRQSPANAFSPKAARFTSPGASMQHSRYAPSPQIPTGPRSPAQYPAPSQPQRMMQIDMPPARPQGFLPVEQPTPVPVMPHDDPPVQPQTRNNQRGRDTGQREGWAAAGHNVIRY
ncbi:hypothetical protein BKA66DRAFT_578257 [Pyrenochaeta sp. MPI-SDFR-AT-0127]|nr:hypothetical protein BKA66DRAFT_578257 [Pyrenochaeta sp. MPI-SDFR-AT-0127]